MSEPFVGEIRMFSGQFAPRGWSLCDGQLLKVSQNDALFSLLGTIYGGDGRTTFGLPDLRGRVPLHEGQGPGLSNRRLGQKLGSETANLTVNQLPSHGHGPFKATSNLASDTDPTGRMLGQTSQEVYTPTSPSTDLNNEAITSVGGGQSHSNIQPFLCVNFIIALVGIMPTRT